MPLSYQHYLKLDQLLSLQVPRSANPEHDELLFITTHQVYELWFKQILHELSALQPALEQHNEAIIFHGFKRILAILKTLVAQIDILETMTPIAFNAFRERLETASGLQSLQFRVLEFMLGKRSDTVLQRYKNNTPSSYQRLLALSQQPSLWDSFLRFLVTTNHPVPAALLKRDVSQSITLSPEIHPTLIQIYHEQSLAMQICERLVDLDEGLQEWRYRHIKMVERTIGMKLGTGGTSIDYLRNTIFNPLFPDLWAIRVKL